MGKANGVSRRRRKNKHPKFVHRSKLQSDRKKRLKKTTKIACEPIREQWENSKSVAKNMKEMGLGLDPNKILSIPKSITQVLPGFHDMDMELEVEENKEGNKRTKRKGKATLVPQLEDEKGKVVTRLEKEADVVVPKNFKFGAEVVKFCVYLIEKYGDDYEAMARDPKNYYQDSPGQIRIKIKKMMRIPINWNSYLRAKEMVGVPQD